jgi:UPF0716 family protein affecting phage T7 exclusion
MAGLQLAGHQALGGGGIAHLLVRLVIWHEIWRFIRLVWRISTFGPIIVALVIVAVVGLAVLRRTGVRWWPRANREGSAGPGTGTGPRDW